MKEMKQDSSTMAWNAIYSLNNINRDYFVEAVKAKFVYYTPIMKLKKYSNGFTTGQIIKELKIIFKGVDISKNTCFLI